MTVTNVLSRRRFVGCGLAGLASTALAAPLFAVIDGLQVGLQTYSLRGIRYPALVSAVQQTGIGECELFSPQVEPTPAEVPNIMKWRETVSPDYFRAIRTKFNQAGVVIVTYDPRMGAGGRGRGGRGAIPGRRPGAMAPAAAITDAQIDRTYACAQALGAKTINAQMPLETARRVASFAHKYQMITAVESVDPGLLTQVVALSPWMRMSVDIGDFTRVGLNARQFVEANYEHLFEVHLKDCKFRGTSVPFGEGDAHMKEIIRFLASKHGPVRATIDCDYPGTGTSVAEVRKCYAYVQSGLA